MIELLSSDGDDDNEGESNNNLKTVRTIRTMVPKDPKLQIRQ